MKINQRKFIYFCDNPGKLDTYFHVPKNARAAFSSQI